MKKTLVVLIAVLLVIGMAACSTPGTTAESSAPASQTTEQAAQTSAETPSDSSETSYKIGALWCTMAAPSVKVGDEGASTKAAELGIEYVGLDAEFDVQKQADQAMNLLSQGVDGIIVNPIDQTSFIPTAKTIYEAGIPLVCFAQRFADPGMDYCICYVGGDEIKVGEACGESMVEALGADGGTVAIVEGAPGSTPQICRTEGFENIINATDNITIVDKQGCNWDRAEALAITEDFLTKYPDLNGIFCHDDNMGIGVYQAVKDAGKLDQIKLVFFNGTKEVIDLVKTGEVYSTITQPVRWGGGKCVEALADYLNGNSVDEWYPDENTPVTIENAATAIPEW